MKEKQECDVNQNRTLVSVVLLHSHKTVEGFFNLHIFPHWTEKNGLYIKIVIINQIWALLSYSESSKVHDWLNFITLPFKGSNPVKLESSL